MDKDSLRGGIFVLIVSALGTGLLTTHHLFDSLGIIPALIIIIIVWLMFLFASDIYTKSIRKSFGAKNLNNLVMNIMGKKWGFVFNVIFIIY
jgi:amino acid permease